MAVAKHRAQRVGVFIDTANLYHSAKNLYKSKVNFGNIVADVVGDRTLVRAIAYVITTEGGEEKAFFEALEKVGIETKAKDLQVFYGGTKKADWDVGITVDAIKLASKLDVVVIVAGDGDFVPMVEYLKAQAQVEVASFGQSTSSKLREVADHFYDLSEDPARYLIGQRSRPTPSNRSMSSATRSRAQSSAGNTKAESEIMNGNSVPVPRPLRPSRGVSKARANAKPSATITKAVSAPTPTKKATTKTATKRTANKSA